MLSGVMVMLGEVSSEVRARIGIECRAAVISYVACNF